MSDEYINCKLCPRACGVNRVKANGICKMGAKPKVARASLHYWEEPCISGDAGSGTVFFSGCQLGCVFCQNETISHLGDGIEIETERLAKIFCELQDKGANNINLVSATQFIPDVVAALNIAKTKGLIIPVVYNSGGYESVDTIKMLDGLVDIYLPDFKYMSKALAKKYSHAENYPDIAKQAIAEMYSQVGKNQFSDNLLKRGMIVRHLVLPGCVDDSKEVIKYLYDTYEDNIWLSIMNQYTPKPGLSDELSRPLYDTEYDEILDYAEGLGINNAFIQEGGTADESFIPPFDYEGVL